MDLSEKINNLRGLLGGTLLLLVTVVGAWPGLQDWWKEKDFFYEKVLIKSIAFVKDVPADVLLFVAGKPVDELYYFQIRLGNEGGDPVQPEDFKSAIVVGLGEATPVTFEIEQEVPEGLDGSLLPVSAVVDGKIHIDPMLLNPGDQLLLSGYAVGGKPQITVTSRISGIEAVRLREGDEGDRHYLVALLFGALSIVLAGLVLPFSELKGASQYQKVVSFLIFGYLLFMSVSFFVHFMNDTGLNRWWIVIIVMTIYGIASAVGERLTSSDDTEDSIKRPSS
jgi:hypothetical protein